MCVLRVMKVSHSVTLTDVFSIVYRKNNRAHWLRGRRHTILVKSVLDNTHML